MTDEALINRLYDIVDEITRIGGEQERTSITPGILVTDASPSDLPTGYIKIVNPRDGTYVPCLTVNGLVVSDNDLVNVLFAKGTEPIALSQSANSPSNTLKVSEVWESDFGAVALEADASGNLTLNGTRTLTIPTDLIHAGDTDTKISFTDDDVEITAGSLSMLKLTEAGQDLITLGPGSGDVDIDFNGDMFLRGSDGQLGIGTVSPSATLEVVGPAIVDTNNDVAFLVEQSGVNDNALVVRTSRAAGNGQVGINGPTNSTFNVALDIGAGHFEMANNTQIRMRDTSGNGRVIFRLNASDEQDLGGSNAALSDTFINAGSVVRGIMLEASTGLVGIGTTSPSAKLHVDQKSTTAAIPVAYFDQADVSEEMFQFETTIGVGNAIEAVGAKTLTTTHFIKVTLPGALTRYVPVGTIA